jgi:LysM repeat protein
MPSLEKAILTNVTTGQRIPVFFNPEEYAVDTGVNYAQTPVPGSSGPVLQFVGGGADTLAMELLVDTHESHREGSRVLNQAGDDVRGLTTRITDLMKVDASTHAPPFVLFTWASLSFRCVLARVTQSFVLFRADGTPVRARLAVTFTELTDLDQEPREVKRETADYSRIHTVLQGETISSIAAATYGDPTLWRPIALHNELDDPRELAAGSRLAVPALPYRDPETGELFEAAEAEDMAV